MKPRFSGKNLELITFFVFFSFLSIGAWASENSCKTLFSDQVSETTKALLINEVFKNAQLKELYTFMQAPQVSSNRKANRFLSALPELTELSRPDIDQLLSIISAMSKKTHKAVIEKYDQDIARLLEEPDKPNFYEQFKKTLNTRIRGKSDYNNMLRKILTNNFLYYPGHLTLTVASHYMEPLGEVGAYFVSRLNFYLFNSPEGQPVAQTVTSALKQSREDIKDLNSPDSALIRRGTYKNFNEQYKKLSISLTELNEYYLQHQHQTGVLNPKDMYIPEYPDLKKDKSEQPRPELKPPQKEINRHRGLPLLV